MKRPKYIPFLIGLTVLIAGASAMSAMILFRKPPAEASTADKEKAIRVDAVAVQPKTVPIFITGYGQAQALNFVKIGPEVSGRVKEIHPQLLVGGIIGKGEALFVIDPEPYEARLNEAKANVAQLESSLARMQTEWSNEKARMESMERARDLAKAQYDRLKDLMKEDVGTQTSVDEAERMYVGSKDQTDQLAHELALYPIRIRESESALASARAQLEGAELDLKRTRVEAPFAARVTSVSLKKDQVIGPGTSVVTIADDSMLEISVPLDSRDARRWLRFNGERALPDGAWFAEPEKVECKIRWTEEPDGHCWVGTLERVEAFDQASRTVTVAIRVRGEESFAGKGNLPLVEGMFCAVEIPGRELENAYEVPQHTVSFEDTIYVVEENRLKTIPIEVAKRENQSAYITNGLSPGQLVITTRLVNPLENSLLDVKLAGETPTS